MNKKLSNIIMICILLSIVYFMITSSNKVIESVLFSISIWKDNLFPTLFPFFIVSSLLMNYGFVDIIGKFLSYPMKKFFKLPGCCGFVLASSLFSGFPSGAKYTIDLVNNNLISTKQAEKLLTFTHYSNPLFILGMIGNLLLNNQKIAYLILISHILSGLITGIFFCRSLSIDNKVNNNFDNKKITINKNNKSFGQILSTVIFDSLNTMFLLLGVVTIFLILTTFINSIITLPDYLKVILSGVLEMTQGVKLASTINLPLIIKITLITGIISFGGLSVHTQVISIISNSKIKYKPFLLARILHSILAMVFVFILYVIFYIL